MKRTLLLVALAWMLCGTALAQDIIVREGSYADYLQTHAAASQASEGAAAELFDVSVHAVRGAYDGAEETVQLSAGAWAEYRVTTAQDGWYQLRLTYQALPYMVQDLEISVAIDGERPFLEADFCLLPRLWQDDGAVQTDNMGNQILPRLIEVYQWQDEILYDMKGVTDSALRFYLAAGEHTLRLTAVSAPFAVAGVSLAAPEDMPSYEELKGSYANAGYRKVSKSVYIEQQAEAPSLRYAIWPQAEADYTSPSTVPSSPSKILYNVLGGEFWTGIDQRVEWCFTVPESGLYQINVKYRQNYVRGLAAYRKVLLDGKLLCEELRAVRFPYCSDWENLTVATDQGEPMFLYLEAGEHTLSLSPAILPMSELLAVLDGAVYQLNAWYRRIITITSTNPDTYRDYYLDKELPGMISDFAAVATLLEQTAQSYEQRMGVSGSELSIMYEVTKQLRDFVERADRIPARLGEFKNNISSLIALRQKMMELPMQMDCLSLSAPGYSLPAAQKGFFELIWFRLQAFMASFTEDYNAVGNVYTDDGEHRPLNVWVSANDIVTSGSASGRDQMMLLKQIIDEQFTKETGIPVNVSLVDSSATLTQAIVAGAGPDVALIIPSGLPVTLAMRGALQDLCEFDLDGFEDEFYPTAMIPYEYNGGLYALPETQTFNMLFYRTDIFEELGIAVPDTWEDFYRIIPIIQKHNLEIGFGENQDLFIMLLMQMGGEFYTDGLKQTGFDQPEAIAAFKQWTELYTKYSFPLYFDAFNRFRTGEMPLVLASYTFSCYLEAVAPELKGQWAMAPLPGIRQEDDTVNRTQPSGGTCGIIMNNLPNKDDAFTFLKWWVSAQAQAAFGNRLESSMGAAARYPTANRDAFEQLPWTAAQKEMLKAQWAQVKPLNNIPGGYNITRSLTNAFRRVVYYYDNPRETLLRYNVDMNLEMERKRIEYGLD